MSIVQMYLRLLYYSFVLEAPEFPEGSYFAGGMSIFLTLSLLSLLQRLC